MAQKNRANMLTDIVSNIYNNLINFITGQNAQDRFVNLLDSSPNILSDKDQANGYVGVGPTLEIFSSYYDEEISRTDLITELTANLAVGGKFYRINDAVGSTITLLVIAESNINLYSFGIDATTGEIGTYDITTDVFSPIVSSAQTLSDTLILGNTSGANDIEFDATQGLLFANSSRLREGTIDAGLGGLKGIAQICGAGYELKWENGRLYVMGSSGNTIRQSLYNFSTAPTTSDDVTLGYQDGSLWTLDNGDTYECTVAATGTWILRANVPDLQQVTTAGATTTNGITVDNGASESITIKHDTIDITNTLGGVASITSTTLTTPVSFNLPYKPTNDTFAMLSDIVANPMTTGGDIIYGGTSGVPTRLANGTAGQVLQSNGTTLAPSWAAASGGGDAYLANDQTFTGENTFAIGSGNDTPIIITKGGAGAGIKVTKSSGSGDAIEVAAGSVSITDETASTIASFDGGKRIKSLNTATYPSLTELALVKGVTGSDIQTQINAKKDTVAFAVMGTIITSPLDSTSYHFGIQPWTPNTTAAFRAFKFTDAGTVEKFSFALSQTLNGSNQTVTIYLRNVTTSTDNLIGTFTSDFGANTTLKTLITALSISVNTTDDWTLKILTPAWGTNPSDWVFGGIISVTK